MITNYNERLDEVLDFIENYGVSASTEGFDKTDSRAEAKQALTSLIKELVAEAKPAEKQQQLPSKIDNETMCRYYRYGGYNFAINEFEQNLLKALEEV